MTASANDNTTSHMMPLNDILTLCQELLDRKRQTVTTVELINMACALLGARIVMGEEVAQQYENARREAVASV